MTWREEIRKHDISPWLAYRLGFVCLSSKHEASAGVGGDINYLLAEIRARDAGECRLILLAHDESVWAWPDLGHIWLES